MKILSIVPSIAKSKAKSDFRLANRIAHSLGQIGMSIALWADIAAVIELSNRDSSFVSEHQLLLPVLGLLAASRRSGQQLFHFSQLSSAKFDRLPSKQSSRWLSLAKKYTAKR